MKESKMLIVVGLLSLFQLIHLNEASGIFELSLTSLVDALGRDLRDDCCAWQNASQFPSSSSQQPSTNHITPAHYNHHPHHLQASQQQQQQQQQQQTNSCDPSKCQLIIRICVKNYQTQIEPSQCTFGELSAQVLRQAADQFGSADSILGGNSLPLQYQPLLRRNAATTQRPLPPRSSSSATNIHHQRMLSQTQALPFLYQQSYLSAAAAARNNQLLNLNGHHLQQQQQQQQLRSSLSGQPRALRTVAFHQPISFPFNFTWPGSFSLIIDAWFESPLQQVAATGSQFSSQLSPTTTYDLYKRQLIIKHSMRGWLAVKNEWTNDVHKTDTATLAYSYRVTCQTNYFGDQCNILCRPRDDFYGHYTCSQQGNIVCLPGWQGSYCLEPICSPGCHEGQGNCSRPNECSCRHGWQGQSCEQCVLYPGCVHGSCNKPFECVCDEGWGGLLCNEDLNFCANHQPCKNDGICSNTFDSNGVGSYTCACAPGFAGKNCERRSNSADQMMDSAPTIDTNNSMSAGNNNSIVGSQLVAPIEEQQQQSQQQVLNNNKPTKQPTKYNQQPSKYNQQQQKQQQQQQQQHSGSFSYPLTQATSINPNMHHQQQQLDSWVMIGWAVIMICSIILVLVFSFRTAIERASQRGQWHHHHGQDGSGAGGHVEDVATLQNQQNLCKSRTSLNVPSVDHKSSPYGRVLSLVDGHHHEHIYGNRYGHSNHYQPGTSRRFQQNNNQNSSSSSGGGTNNNSANNSNDSSPNCRRSDNNKAKKSHQKQHQQYQSQHNLHATHENNLDSSSSSDAASSSSETLAPPPPYTIAQSTHSYPNLAYQSLSSHYSSAAAAASAHYFPLPTTTAGQRAPKMGSSQVTAISNAIYGSNPLYGSYSTYAGIPVVATTAATATTPAPTANGQQLSDGNGNNAAAAAAANQSAHYLIYPVHFMAN